VAADGLAAASDLLWTHFDGQDSERSEWAEVIRSGPVIRALTEEAGTWARRLAPWAHWHGEQNSMAASLLAASRNDDRALLYAIPAAVLPERMPPREGEPVAELCAGITCTAERIRFLAFPATGHPALTPAISARTWQYTATAAAVTMDTAAIVLGTLAASRTTPGGIPTAATLTAARDSWRGIASALADVTTDTPPALGPEATDLSYLVIRMGRLAFDNPGWTPRHPAEPRSPAQLLLLGSETDAANVLAAIHLSADAIATVAVSHWSAVTTAIKAGRLYVPTRSLPEGYDVPHRSARIPPDRAEELTGAYKAAARTSAAATDPLASAVLAAGGPSCPIALARQATRRDRLHAWLADLGLRLARYYASAICFLLTPETPARMSHLARAVRGLCLHRPDAVGWSSWTARAGRGGVRGVHQSAGSRSPAG
jgi:hypothetical protein